jgi:hypothetical protein
VLAEQVLQLRRRIKDLDKGTAAAFAAHPQAPVMQSPPGMGPIVAAEFTVAVADLSTFATPTTWPPTPHWRRCLATRASTSGTCTAPPNTTGGSATCSTWRRRAPSGSNGPSRTYYQRKRAGGRRHQHALIAPARRRVNVLRAMPRDNQPYGDNTTSAAG